VKRWLTALVLLLVAAAAGWALGSPYLTVWQMKRAAEVRDLDALARHIDFPAVRAGVKAQLAERMRGRDRGVLGALVAAGIAGTVVDSAVSPEGMRVIFAAAPLAGTAPPGTIRIKAQGMVLRRDGWDRFRLVRRDGTGTALIFRLHGAQWLLSDIRLPPDPLYD
jgi:hypothetical protein